MMGDEVMTCGLEWWYYRYMEYDYISFHVVQLSHVTLCKLYSSRNDYISK